MDLKRGIDKAVSIIVKDLEKQKKNISTSKEIAQVSYYLCKS